MEDFRKQFGEKVRYYRKQLDMTQDAFAAKANTTPQTLSGIERGKTFPEYPTILNIINALGIHPAKLFAFDDSVWNIEDKELQSIIYEAFKDLSPVKRKIVLNFIKSLGDIEEI